MCRDGVNRETILICVTGRIAYLIFFAIVIKAKLKEINMWNFLLNLFH